MKYRIYILTLTLAVLAVSCLKEKSNDCYSELDLYFSYHGDGATQIFGKKINDVDIFVFDKNYVLVQQETYDKAALAKKQGATLALSPGIYHFLCVGNFCDQTIISDISAVSSLSEIYFENPKTSTGTIPTSGALFSSSKTIIIPDINGTHRETIEFESLHYEVRMEIMGLDVDANWSLQVRESVGRICCDLRGDLNVTVVPGKTFVPADHMLYSSFNLYRQPDRDFIFDFIDPSGETMCSVNFFEFLDRYPEIDLNKEEVYIPIRLQISQDEIGVIVPEWGIIQVTPEW